MRGAWGRGSRRACQMYETNDCPSIGSSGSPYRWSWLVRPLRRGNRSSLTMAVVAQDLSLEAWTRSTSDGHGYWAQPACNFAGDLELSVGGARAHPDESEPVSIVQLQAKRCCLHAIMASGHSA